VTDTATGFRGIIPYLVSPIDPDTGEVDEAALRALVAHLVEVGVHGISPLGSTGEVMLLDGDQRRRVVEICVDEAAGRIPVIPGVSSASTRAACIEAERFADLGANGLIAIRENAYPVNDAGIGDFFAAVATSVELPIVLYTNPGLLGADISAAVLDRLLEIDNVRYLKDASGVTGRILSVINRHGDRLGVFSASAHIPVLVFQLGGIGWMAGPACVIPEASLLLYELSQAGRWDDAMALQRRAWPLNELFTKYGLGPCVKAALEVSGFAVGPPIAPTQALGEAPRAQLRAVLGDIAEAVDQLKEIGN
jgi:4-hydroxy-tetrahydrodipicolinate synthase